MESVLKVASFLVILFIYGTEGVGQDMASDLDEHCQEAYNNCKHMHRFHTPRMLEKASKFDGLCGGLQSFKSCYQSGMTMACPLLSVQDMLDKACANKEKYKKAVDCYIGLQRSGNNFGEPMKSCRQGTSSDYRRNVVKSYGSLSAGKLCGVLTQSESCMRKAFQDKCEGDEGDFLNLYDTQLALANC